MTENRTVDGDRAPSPPQAGASGGGSSLRRALHSAGAAARDVWKRTYGSTLTESALEDSVQVLLEALTEPPGAPMPPEVREPPSLLHVRMALLDLIRKGYVEEGSEADDAFRDRIRRFEEVRAHLEPEWDEQVEASFSGPRANELLAEVGHDLRSPLTSVMFLSEVLREAPEARDDPHKARQLGLIYSGALTMLNIVNNFMEVVRRGGEELEGEPTVFSLEELLEETRRTVQPMADERGLHFETTVEIECSDRRVGYPVPLSRILLNLTTNALKFTREGEVRVVMSEPAPGVVEFAVRDTGPGISEERQKAIFRVFEPSQDRHGVRFSGTGLGLVIVRRLLRAMGSELICRSTVDEGTTMSFRVELGQPG